MAVDITPSTLLEFAKTIDSEPQPTSKTRMATVTRIGDDGTPYVTFPDGTETPLAGTVSTLKIGDSVMVSMQSGKLRANANVSDPAASNERMTRTETTALAAAKAADAASVAADAAEYEAARAKDAADDAQSSADNAQASANSALASATNASEYASRALGNLSTVQSVAETLTWITQHGTMTLTTDTALDPTHVYFVQDAEGDYVVGSTHYSIVAEPVASQLSSYYVLTIDESLNNYVGTHLALTNEGLWLLPASSGTDRVLIATGAGSTYTEAGTYILEGTGATLAKFGANGAVIGKLSAAHSVIDADGQRFYGSNGITQLAHIGYGQGTNRSNSISVAPYYTFGERAKVSAYSTTTPYNPGDLCTNNGVFYCCLETTQGEWDSDKWQALGAPSVIGNLSVAEGYAHSIGYTSHAEGNRTVAYGVSSHAEGYGGTLAYGEGSHAEGFGTIAKGTYSHAEGRDTLATGYASHAQNQGTIARGSNQTSIGCYNEEDVLASYVFIVGNGTADNARSNALTIDWNGNVECGNVNGTATQSTGTLASSDNQTALGTYNVEDNSDTYAVIVGNGTADNARSNALTLDWNGVLYVASGYMLPNGSQIWDNTNRIIHMQTPDAGTAQAEFTFEPDGKIYSRKRTRSSAGASWGSWSSWTAIAG